MLCDDVAGFIFEWQSTTGVRNLNNVVAFPACNLHANVCFFLVILCSRLVTANIDEDGLGWIGRFTRTVVCINQI